jgi:hypothetical protein
MRLILLVDCGPFASSTLTHAPRVETDAAVRETNSITYGENDALSAGVTFPRPT